MALNLPQLKRKIKKQLMRLPHIRARRERYIKYIRSCYDYSQKPPTIICSTCIGGMISHNLGLRFMSPTVNVWLTSSDLVKLVCDPKKYLSEEVSFTPDTGCGYPVGKICDITVYFQHYTSNEEAYAKWMERRERVDLDNLFIILDDKRLTDEEIRRLADVKCKRLVIFTAGEEKSSNFFCYDCYKGAKETGLYSVRDIHGFAPFEREFNYAAWLSGKKDFRQKSN